MNYPETDKPYTRISEHKYFSSWETNENTAYFEEYSRACRESDIPYYPIRLVEGSEMLSSYEQLSSEEKGITFAGRLGTYRYLDMDVPVKQGLICAYR